ncbi:MAG: hypothetical protein R3293_02060 [Candidatus Promineifilaceae bacterium]|nr:hypothetical protein [Candidatus Promineifilaceae bacterium]
MDYGNILRRSWDIIWNHKFMIFLGFLAALGSGAGSGGGSGGGGDTGYTFDGSEFGALPEISENIGAILATAGILLLGLICFLFVLGIVLWLLRLTAQAGLIDAAYRLDAGEKVSLGEALSAGWHKLGRMVGLNIVLFGLFAVLALGGIFILAGAVGASFAGAASGGDEVAALLGSLGVGFIALFCCLLCALFIFGIIVSIVYPFAQRAVVLEDMGVFASIKRGWQVIRENLGEVIVLLLIFLMLGILVGAITLAVFIPVAAVSFAPVGLRIFGGGSVEVLDVLLASGGLLCLILLGALINAVFVSFRSTAFTLAYGEFTTKNLNS